MFLSSHMFMKIACIHAIQIPNKFTNVEDCPLFEKRSFKTTTDLQNIPDLLDSFGMKKVPANFIEVENIAPSIQ